MNLLGRKANLATLNAPRAVLESCRRTAPYAVPVDEVMTELRRVLRRWQQLSEDQAHENAALMRTFAQELADQVRSLHGSDILGIPDLGDAALADQLAVTVYDACRVGLEPQALDGLARLRRALP